MATCKVDSVVRIPTSVKNGFFTYWFEFLRPIHSLTKREIEVIACLARHRYELSKVIKDDAILDEQTMGDTIRKEILEELNITSSFYNQILRRLRSSNIIINNRINPRFLPNLDEDTKEFRLLLKFELKDEPE